MMHNARFFKTLDLVFACCECFNLKIQKYPIYFRGATCWNCMQLFYGLVQNAKQLYSIAFWTQHIVNESGIIQWTD